MDALQAKTSFEKINIILKGGKQNLCMMVMAVLEVV